MEKSKISVVSQTDIGVYVWKMPDGRIVADSDMNYLSISAFRGDLQAIKRIADAARYYGVEEGQPYFLEGARKISDGEYEEQKERMRQGLIPDELDIGVYKDALEQRNRN